MGRLHFERVLECFSLSIPPNCCMCTNYLDNEEEERELERKALVASHLDQVLKLRDIVEGTKTLAFHLEPKTVELKVNMHCNGCAKKVQKHISKMEGVTSYEVDLESKKVIVIGDITPFEVLQSISKVKFAELWVPTP
ncbi:Heavy metal-associated isoprenylated plant protein 37 [Rhynchospora pubera]|uniref:Heavy metal-associated isoprenylated plant protein 37 n=1 Tax=Rhynchospora pubera TaxID=906938 RepID=A0AAV8GVQ5_9POAL|nr:Heavy metal-associated isoprenylated plant protein 37 [Rhynchospora pubera]KAJ4806898.1 Heavy metal-associated isoprenylated plant protein 37 [Rhynchospora pubera]